MYVPYFRVAFFLDRVGVLRCVGNVVSEANFLTVSSVRPQDIYSNSVLSRRSKRSNRSCSGVRERIFLCSLARVPPLFAGRTLITHPGLVCTCFLLLFQSDLSSSRLSDGKLGCSCKKCHADRNPLVADEEDPSEGTCWKDVLAEYECDICFEVLVGVHVLGEKRREEKREEEKRREERRGRARGQAFLLLLLA